MSVPRRHTRVDARGVIGQPLSSHMNVVGLRGVLVVGC